MRLQVKAFMLAVRAIVKHTMKAEDAERFKPSISPTPRLRSLGVLTHCAMIRANVDLQPRVQRSVAVHILRSPNRTSMKAAEDIIDRQKSIPVRRYADIGKTAWSRSVKETKARFLEGRPEEGGGLREYEEEGVHQERRQREQAVKRQWAKEGATPRFLCGVCEHKVKASRKAFKADTLDCKTWCNSCKKSYIANAWTCECKLPWYLCPKHGHREGEDVKQDPKRRKIEGSRNKKRAFDIEEEESKISPAAKSTKSMAGQGEFRLMQSGLSAGLKRKFGYLFEGGSQPARE